MKGKNLAWLVGLKTVCCGGPLVLVAVASGALALVDLLLGATVLLALGTLLLVVRRRRVASRPPAGRHGVGALPIAQRRPSLVETSRR